MREYRWTLVGLILAIALWVASYCFNIDYFNAFTLLLEHYEHNEADEVVFPAIAFYIFLMADMAREHRLNRIRKEKEKVYRSSLRAMNHILNNFLQKMMVFKVAAEEVPDFNPDVLEQYDRIIKEATAQIEALEKIKDPDEKNILTTIDATALIDP